MNVPPTQLSALPPVGNQTSVQLLRPWLAGVLLAVGCLFIYRTSLGFGFVMFDDDVNFLFNRDFGPLDAGRLRWIATEHAVMMRYVPLGWLACCTIASIGGLDPFWFHLTSVLLHAGACVVLFAVLVRAGRLLGFNVSNSGIPRTLSLLPFALAAWWGWHPLRVETVAWVTTLIYLLATLLGLFSLLIFLPALDGERPRRARLGASLVLFVAALLAHPAAISFLPLLAACAAVQLLRRDTTHPLRRFGKTLLPFVLVGALDLAISLVVRQLGSVIPHAPTPSLAEFGVGQRLAQAGAVLTHFLEKIIWPAGLTPAYPLLETVDPLAPRFLLPLAICAGVAFLCLRALRRNSAASLFALATLAACAPFLGLQEHPFFPSDRYTHIMMIGLTLWALASVSVSRSIQLLLGRALPTFLGVLLPLWILISVRQLPLWSSDRTLFEGIAAIQTGPGKRDAYSARLVNIQLNRGEFAAARLSLEHMRRDGAHDSVLRDLTDKLSAAEAARGPVLCASLLMMQARYAATHGDDQQAVDRLRRALAYSADFDQARFSLGMLLARDGDVTGALTQLLWLQKNPHALPDSALPALAASVASVYLARGEERRASMAETLPTRSTAILKTP